MTALEPRSKKKIPGVMSIGHPKQRAAPQRTVTQSQHSRGALHGTWASPSQCTGLMHARRYPSPSACPAFLARERCTLASDSCGSRECPDLARGGLS